MDNCRCADYTHADTCRNGYTNSHDNADFDTDRNPYADTNCDGNAHAHRDIKFATAINTNTDSYPYPYGYASNTPRLPKRRNRRLPTQ